MTRAITIKVSVNVHIYVVYYLRDMDFSSVGRLNDFRGLEGES